MQLPDHLLRTYHKYKADERDLLAWIEYAAECSGYQFKSAAAKLRGRERTLATRNANQTANEGLRAPQGQSRRNLRISLFDVSEPVSAIAASSRITEIPHDIAIKLERIIALREGCVSWFRSNTSQHDQETRESNQKHLYPLILLRKVLEKLEAKLPKSHETRIETAFTNQLPQTRERRSFKPLGPNGRNLFTVLTLNDGGENDAPDDVRDGFNSQLQHSLPTTAATPALSDDEKQQEEYNFAQFCLYEDVQRIEDFLILELVRYSLDQQNCDTLPYLVNSALDMIWQTSKTIEDSIGAKTRRRKAFATYVLQNHGDIIQSSPLMRMQEVVAIEIFMKKTCPGEACSADCVRLLKYSMCPGLFLPLTRNARRCRAVFRPCCFLSRSAERLCAISSRLNDGFGPSCSQPPTGKGDRPGVWVHNSTTGGRLRFSDSLLVKGVTEGE